MTVPAEPVRDAVALRLAVEHLCRLQDSRFYSSSLVNMLQAGAALCDYLLSLISRYFFVVTTSVLRHGSIRANHT
jgi:hypothetical protein